MKLATLNFLFVSALATISSDAYQRGEDAKRIRRNLAKHHHKGVEKGEEAMVKSAKAKKVKKTSAMEIEGTEKESMEKSDGAVTTDSMVNSDSMMTQTAVAAELSSMSMQSFSMSMASDATSLPTFSPTLAPSIEVASVQVADASPACPPAYDVTKTDYAGGELVLLDDNIFECHSLYVMYCNIGEWDDALLDEDANAEEMWNDAWVHVGPCSVSEVVLESTSSPTISPTLAPSIEVASVQGADAIPACPPAYDIAKTDYVGGDIVTITDNIFECNSTLVKYCNIGEWDDALLDEDPNAEDFWSDAWVYVSTCSISEVVPESTSSPTISPTLAPSIETASVRAADAIPACPLAYDSTKTDYAGGDIVTVDGNIFKCHSLYVMYCNIGEWDDALLAQDANAEEMWDDSWVLVGPCA